MVQKIRDFLRLLLQPGLDLKRWAVVLLGGLLQIVFGLWLWLGASVRRHPLVRIITLGFLPSRVRGTIFLVLGTILTVEGWQRVSNAIVRVMLPERPEANLGQVLRERQQDATGRRVVVIGGEPGIDPLLTALHSLRNTVRVDVILSASESGRRVQALQTKFNLTGQQIIYPTTDDATLYAELDDGRLLEGATTINRFTGGSIKSLFLSRDIRRFQVWESEQNGVSSTTRLRDYMPNVSENALDVIKNAELILFAPGRIYTQILPNLTLPRFAQAIRESNATKIFVANLMSEPNHTNEWTVADHLEIIKKTGDIRIDYVITHSGTVSTTMLQQYQNEGSQVVTRAHPAEEVSSLVFADTGEETTLLEGAVVLAADVITERPQMVTFQRGEEIILREMPVVRHDPKKIVPLLQQLLNEKRI
jgi:uncharacterized cofD-like protein